MLQAGSGFLSQHSKEVSFGLGTAKGPVNASIHWPSGLVQQLHDLPINHRVWVDEGVEPSRIEPFQNSSVRSQPAQSASAFPATIETWLLVPVPAPVLPPPGAKPMLFQLEFDQVRKVTTVSADVAATYNSLYRYLFDRHRDLTLPTSFLIDAKGDIVKVYQGAVNARLVEEDLPRIPQTWRTAPWPWHPIRRECGTSWVRKKPSVPWFNLLSARLLRPGRSNFPACLFEPHRHEAHYGARRVYLKQEKNGDARANFDEALKLTASYPDTAPNARGRTSWASSPLAKDVIVDDHRLFTEVISAWTLT